MTDNGGYMKYGDLTEEQKEEALALRPQWNENVLFWVEEGHVYKCSMSAKKHHEDNSNIHTFQMRPLSFSSR